MGALPAVSSLTGILAPLQADWLTWGIVAAAAAGVLLRPFATREYMWALAGALALTGLGLLPLAAALAGVWRGMDVYLFLTGMMLLSELARQFGLFDWLAAHTANLAAGSAPRLFSLLFGVGTLVTTFLSNDATAVVLTPAVAAVARAARAAEPLPYLLICAFVANAASFVLPISNPANLVIYGRHMPPLLHWIAQYALPSALALAATYFVLRLTQRAALRQPLAPVVEVPALSRSGLNAGLGIVATAVLLLGCSGLGLQLGLPTFLAGAATALLVLLRRENRDLAILRNISWGVLPLVAGLFVLVAALQRTGVTAMLAAHLQAAAQAAPAKAAWAAGILLAVGANGVNNLPAGLVAANVVDLARVPERVRGAMLIGVDLGPNLSVTGSLATLLWLEALRREGHGMSAWKFLGLGLVVMPPALLLALVAL